MSRVRDIKKHSDNNINIFELLSIFSPGKKPKYTELMLRLMKKNPNIDSHINEIKKLFKEKFNLNEEDLVDIPKFHFIFLHVIINHMFDIDGLCDFKKFCELNERGLIKQNDLTKYSSFDDITKELDLAVLVEETKKLEKEIKIIYQDSEWLIIKPLTYFSSKKYGANTKWCTSSDKLSNHFDEYSNNGILIYSINKKTGYKVASYFSLKKTKNEFSWWNQEDDRIDSSQAKIPNIIKDIIFEESNNNNGLTNSDILKFKNKPIKENNSLKRSIIRAQLRESDLPLDTIE
jgi:hypothetical protein